MVQVKAIMKESLRLLVMVQMKAIMKESLRLLVMVRLKAIMKESMIALMMAIDLAKMWDKVNMIELDRMNENELDVLRV